MRLSQRVYLIASGRAGCALSHPSDCNAYAVNCGGALLLVDSGVGASTQDLIGRLAADGARRFSGGETIPIGDTALRVLRTSGHSRDMLSFLFDSPDGVLAFTGDTVFHGGRILISTTWDCEPAGYAKSLQNLLTERVDGLFPGHAIWSLQRGSEQIALCRPYLDQGLLPPNLL